MELCTEWGFYVLRVNKVATNENLSKDCYRSVKMQKLYFHNIMTVTSNKGSSIKILSIMDKSLTRVVGLS